MRKKITVIWILLVVFLFLLGFNSFVGQAMAIPVNVKSTGQSTITPTSPPTLTITMQPTTTPLPSVTYEQLLSVYVSVLETTKWAVTAVLSVVTVLSCIGGLVMSSITLVGGATGLVAYSRIADAAKRAESAKATVDKLDISVENINQQSKKALLDIQSVDANSIKVREELQRNQEELRIFKAGVKGDTEAVHKTLLLVQIEERSIELYSDELVVQKRAIKALKAMCISERPAFVRRHVVMLLGTYANDYNDNDVIRWLENIAQHDPATSVRSSAKYELEKFTPKSDN
jgi:hypothetical protein